MCSFVPDRSKIYEESEFIRSTAEYVTPEKQADIDLNAAYAKQEMHRTKGLKASAGGAVLTFGGIATVTRGSSTTATSFAEHASVPSLTKQMFGEAGVILGVVVLARAYREKRLFSKVEADIKHIEKTRRGNRLDFV